MQGLSEQLSETPSQNFIEKNLKGWRYILKAGCLWSKCRILVQAPVQGRGTGREAEDTFQILPLSLSTVKIHFPRKCMLKMSSGIIKIMLEPCNLHNLP